ncbi:hypothetical protein CASFOL_008701 [Castilleja foliolosa]|uniref:FRIGIDA-like protein n=1 Tax=Castilleja foliolosa TaxID=1961234 RepID=A0ABD3E004_9LAMI
MDHFLDAQKQPPPVTPAVSIPETVREWTGNGENILRSLVGYVSDIESREHELRVARDSLEERLKDLEEREKRLSHIESREKQLDEQFNLVDEHIEKLEMARSDVSELLVLEREKLKVIDQREKEIEQRQREFYLLREGKLREIASEEEAFAEKVRLVNEKFRTRDGLCRVVMERLESGFKTFEGLKVKVDEKFKSIGAVMGEVDLIRESLEKRFEEMEKEFNSVQEDKMQELEMKERKLNDVEKEIEKREKEIEQREREFNLLRDKKLREISSGEEALAEKVRLVNEKFITRDGLCRGVMERLESGRNMFEGLKVKIDEKFKSMVDVIGEAEALEKRFKEMEKEFYSVQKDKMQELETKERKLNDVEKKIEIRKKDLENMEKKFEVYQEKKMGELVLAEEKLRLVGEGFIQEVLLREEKFDKQDKMMHGLLERLELARKNVNDMNMLVSERFKSKVGELEHEPGIMLDKDVVMCEEREVDGTKNEKDFGKELEMLINDTGKDLELIGAEVFRVLFLSSDPAKLVLDAIEEFCMSCLGIGDIELNVRRKCIVLLVLDELTKMSPNIHPCVKEAAIIVAVEWKLKMVSGENSLEVFGFLHFLAAYNLSSCFDKDELLSLLKMVAQYKQAPEFCRILGLSENMTGFVQNLINEKRYLLASAYIHECGLQSEFPQATVLSYHVEHLKVKRRRENTSLETLDKAFANEIADLHAAIKHVIKYGLESDCSPIFLKSRIKALEANRACLLINRTDAQKQKNPKRFAQNKAATAAAYYSPAAIAQKNHVQNSENVPYTYWEARVRQSTKFNEVPATHPNMSNKRRRVGCA